MSYLIDRIASNSNSSFKFNKIEEMKPFAVSTLELDGEYILTYDCDWDDGYSDYNMQYMTLGVQNMVLL